MLSELKIKHFQYIYIYFKNRTRKISCTLIFESMLSKCLATIIILKSHGRLVREEKNRVKYFLG